MYHILLYFMYVGIHDGGRPLEHLGEKNKLHCCV